MNITPKKEMLVPRADPGERDISIDLGRLKRLEARIDEVGFVTPHKAPELLATFNKACLDVDEYVTFLEAELVKARAAVDKWRAHLLLDVVPERLKERGLASAKDTREAAIVQDEEHQRLLERSRSIEMAIKYLKTKYKGFEMAYQSVKKILGGDKYDHSQHVNDPTDERPVGVDMPEGFGNPRL